MAGIEFPDFAGTLGPLIQMKRAEEQNAFTRDRMRMADEKDAREREADQYIPGAMSGDKDALGQLAVKNPRAYAAIIPHLDKLNTQQRQTVKDATEASSRVAMAVLNAAPADKVAAYDSGMKELYALGYGDHLKEMPAQYTPGVEGMLRAKVDRMRPWADYFKEQSGGLQPQGGFAGGAAGPAAPSGSSAPAPNRDAFVAQMMPHALEVSRQTGLDPRLVVAQAALESGWGAAAPGNNFFGIKSHGQPGGQTLATTEAGPGGGLVPTQDSFRTYQNPGESAQDYAKFLQTNGRYGPMLAAKDLPSQIDALGKSGYATDPAYADKIRQIAFSLPTPGAATGPPVALGPQPTMGAVPPQMAALGNNAVTGQVPPQMAAYGRNAAPMPQPPAGLTRTASGATVDPSIPPPPFMPQGGDQPTGNQPGVMPGPPQPGIKDLTQYLPPGHKIGTAKNAQGVDEPVYDKSGRLGIFPPGAKTKNDVIWIDVPKPEAPPAGYRPAAGGLEFIPGGPADPARTMADKIPAGYRVKPDGSGTLEFIPGGPADPAIVRRAAPMNHDQARSASFADRMMEAEDVLATVGDQGTKFLERLSEKAPAGAGGYAQSKEYQAFRQARDNFINAQLRSESGAAINADEYVKADKQYFPQPGDGPDVLKQKALNRKLAIEGMKRAAGPTYEPSPSVPKSAEAEKPKAASGVKEGATATNPGTGEKIIYRNGQWTPLR